MKNNKNMISEYWVVVVSWNNKERGTKRRKNGKIKYKEYEKRRESSTDFLV